MDKIRPRTLSGFMELPPDKQVQMDKMRAVLAETYARYGFTPLDTPAIEAAEVLILGLNRGDLDWRDIVNPKKKS